MHGGKVGTGCSVLNGQGKELKLVASEPAETQIHLGIVVFLNTSSGTF